MERREPKKRNRRSDSTAAAVQASQNAALGPHEPPMGIDFPETARVHWDWIMSARARDRWLPLDLANAAELAIIYDDIGRMRTAIRAQGDVGEDGKAHPLHKVVADATRRVIALSRMLHVHPEATEGRSQSAAKSGENDRKAAGATLPSNVSRLIPRVAS